MYLLKCKTLMCGFVNGVYVCVVEEWVVYQIGLLPFVCYPMYIHYVPKLATPLASNTLNSG